MQKVTFLSPKIKCAPNERPYGLASITATSTIRGPSLQICALAWWKLKRISVHKTEDWRERKDFEIKPNRPVVDVVNVHLNPAAHFLGGIRFTSQTANLSQAGHARFNLVAVAITSDARSIVFIVNERMRPRPDEGHFAAQYVDELRQFIDASFTQQAPNPGSPRIVSRSLLNVVAVFRDCHGAELEHDDLALIAAMSTLPKEHGPWGVRALWPPLSLETTAPIPEGQCRRRYSRSAA